jgi:hypothetical protein
MLQPAQQLNHRTNGETNSCNAEQILVALQFLISSNNISLHTSYGCSVLQ